MMVKAPRAERDAANLGRGARFLTADFVLRQVVPRVPYLAGLVADWSVEIARVTPSRLTLRYIFDHRVTVYGKAYREAGPGKSASLLLFARSIAYH